MLFSVKIPHECQPPEDEEAGEDDTPRDPLPQPGSLPSSPSARKTKSRAVRPAPHRINSLKDAKVLLVSDMHRTESAMDLSLFQYHQHFEGPWQLVGKTHLSEVFRVCHRGSGEVFAVKRSRRRFRSKLQRERCLREIRAVAALPTHPNIVNQYRAWQEGGHFYIQMDFCEGGSLAHQACAHGQCMADEQLWRTACQAAQGLHFLHFHGVLHLDIKPENIYLSAGCWRIGDFGLAVARERNGSMDWEEGDGDYVAPELLQAGGEPSPASDIFSLGATLFECATGCKLSRSEGWTAINVERLEVPHRPAAFVQMLRAMLQPAPSLRPTAKQVLEMVAREQPAIAAAAADAVAATGAAEARAAGAGQEGSVSVPLQQAAPVMAMAPSPFVQQVQGVADGAAAAAMAEKQQVQAAVGSRAFSFDVPHGDHSGFALTPGQPLRLHNRQRSSGGGICMPPGTAVKGTPVGRGRLCGRWAPALSPLISEGALTPGAAAALAGLTPVTCGSSKGVPASVLGSGRGLQHAGTPLDIWRPTPLQLPPQTAPMAVATGGIGGMLSTQHPSSSGTQDSRDGWLLRRRDIISPDSDALHACHSDSDYSYSCGTGHTASDMDFADALSPMSQELGGLMPSAAGPTPSAGTPESLRWHEGDGDTPGTDLQLQYSAQRDGAGPGAPGPLAVHLQQVAPSLAFDLHTSPEFLMQLPPGSTDSLSRSSSLDGAPKASVLRQPADSISLPSRTMSVRCFPTLDSWGSQLHMEGGVCKPPSRGDPPVTLTAQRLSHNFASAEQLAVAPTVAGIGDGAGTAAPAPFAARGLRKRQHSSRRTLIAALSRDNSVASCIDGMQPQGKSRHIMLDSGPNSPCGGSDDPMLGLPRLLHRSGSTLGRETAAAVVTGLAEAAAKALAASGMPAADAKSTVTAVGGLPLPLRFDSFCSDVCDSNNVAALSPLAARPPPQSPLHARMTGMKLRDVD